MHKNKNMILNLATGKYYSVLEVIKTAELVLGKNISYNLTSRRSGEPSELYAVSNKANEILNWQPKFSDLDTIIKSMWEVYK